MKLSPALNILNVEKKHQEQILINGKPLYAVPGGGFTLSPKLEYLVGLGSKGEKNENVGNRSV